MSTIILVGASGSGKSTIEKEISNRGYEKIISYTTRKPRNDEKNGKDYWFINNYTFLEMLKDGLFAEYEEYSEGRFYGTLKSDYVDGNKVAVLTPNGIRQIRNNLQKLENVTTVLIETKLGTRMKRYIDRIGVDNFTFKDKDELCSRTERDFGMFLGVDKYVDIVVHNEERTDIKELADKILWEDEKKKM